MLSAELFLQPPSLLLLPAVAQLGSFQQERCGIFLLLLRRKKGRKRRRKREANLLAAGRQQARRGEAVTREEECAWSSALQRALHFLHFRGIPFLLERQKKACCKGGVGKTEEFFFNQPSQWLLTNQDKPYFRYSFFFFLPRIFAHFFNQSNACLNVILTYLFFK